MNRDETPSRGDRWGWGIFAVVIALMVLWLAGALFGSGIVVSRSHPVLPHVDVGVALGTRGSGLVATVAAWAGGILVMGLFVFAFFLAAPRTNRVIRSVTAVAGAWTVIWTTLVWLASSKAHGPIELWGSFPSSTAVMLYLLWPCPIAFVVLYVLRFRSWVWSEASERELERMLKERIEKS